MIEENGTRDSFETRALLTVVPRGDDAQQPDATRVWIELVDGSRIEASGYSVSDRVASLVLGDRTVRVDTRNIRTVRFHAPSAPLDRQWEEILQGRHSGDVVVLRRAATSLDQLEGVFRGVNDQVVEFEFDNELIPVRRERLEGLLYFQPVVRDLPDPVCVVHELGGPRGASSRWNCAMTTWRW